jgi:hypothetical protein
MARKKKADAPPQKDKREFPDTPRGWAERWGIEFGKAKEWHRRWKKRGDVANNRYLLESGNQSGVDQENSANRLALFSSNINTLMSMLYGKVPQVSVDRRYQDPEDQIGRVASEMATRILNADIEEAGEDFSTILRSCLQDRLLPGLGCARVRYDFDEAEDEDEEDEVVHSAKAEEWVEDVYVPWEDVIWSPSRYWKENRWIAFRLYKDKEEVKELLAGIEDAEEIADELPYTSKAPQDSDKQTSETWDKCEIWEIWDKQHKKVWWFVEGHDRTLKSVDDPLELDGFFPCPPFFIANTTTKRYVPKSDYDFAASLYREIDQLEIRISLLTTAVKVVGVYDKKAGQDIGRLVNETAENKLIPVDAWAAFQERGGIKGSIEFLPIEDVVNAIQVLQDQQSKRIEQLFQVTGMADIMRGQAEGDGRVSATEQQIKVKFASVRVQSIQDEFTRFATDLQKLRFEVICKHFDIETIIRNSNMLQTADAQLCVQAAELLKNTEVAKWRIQIQPESMAMVDYAQLKQERTEYINSLGIFLQSSFPIAEKFPQAAPILMELLKWGLAGFKGSKQIEGVIDRAMAAMEKSGAPPPPDPEQQKIQAEMQQNQQKHQLDMEKMQAQVAADRQRDQAEFQFKLAEMQADFKAKMAEIQAEQMHARSKLQMDQQAHQQQLAHDAQSMSMEREHAQARQAMELQAQEQQNALKMSQPSNGAV